MSQVDPTIEPYPLAAPESAASASPEPARSGPDARSSDPEVARMPVPAALTPEAAPRCPRCGYLLFGLPELRCPECGLQLDEFDLVRARWLADLSRADRRAVAAEWGATLAGAALLAAGYGATLWRALGVQSVFPQYVNFIVLFLWSALTAGTILWRLILGLPVYWTLLIWGGVWTAAAGIVWLL